MGMFTSSTMVPRAWSEKGAKPTERCTACKLTPLACLPCQKTKWTWQIMHTGLAPWVLPSKVAGFLRRITWCALHICVSLRRKHMTTIIPMRCKTLHFVHFTSKHIQKKTVSLLAGPVKLGIPLMRNLNPAKTACTLQNNRASSNAMNLHPSPCNC